MPIIGHETRHIPMALSGAQRQRNYINRLKDRAAYADVLAARLAQIEAEQACMRLHRFAVPQAGAKPLAHRRKPLHRSDRGQP
jgi:hypothetical protein